MFNKWQHWDFWKWVKTFAEKKMRRAWMLGGNCDSKCYQCNQWESHGNTIYTTENYDDGTQTRQCKNCDYSWKTIFTPAGFIRIDND